MVNINIEIPDDVHKKAKLSAIQEDKTLKEFVVEKIHEGLGRLKK